jgi:hypothetical protein
MSMEWLVIMSQGPHRNPAPQAPVADALPVSDSAASPQSANNGSQMS